jgi:hypothetical protein
MIRLALTNGGEALIDDQDAHLAAFKWSRHVNKDGSLYAIRYEHANGVREGFWLHREVLGFTRRDPIVDHRDGNGLDCRRANLRPTTKSQNARNRAGPTRANRRSPYLGVCWVTARAHYVATIQINGRSRYLGSFPTAEAANVARLTAEKTEYGIEPRREAAFREAGMI